MTEPKPWLIDEAGSEARRHAPATLRNRDAIVDVLRDYLPASGTVLEIASGSGEHIVHFAQAFPHLVWQPSDCEPAALASIAAWAAQAGASNVQPPLPIDAAQPDWPIGSADAILCINMMHISPWDATLGLFKGCAQALTEEAPIILYGPYLEQGVETAASNLAFDESLKARNPAWGLRHLDAVDRVASDHGFARTSRHAMPANNLALVYRKRSA
ncbi:DUF938 domain-containing protein [Blastomonas sp.]|uniref:DUF938 domain-containing protein n=1 Tax=Blastomonas sp. TaxID=1909299 RepID=UPI00391D423E